jgi:hypothetical protein
MSPSAVCGIPLVWGLGLGLLWLLSWVNQVITQLELYLCALHEHNHHIQHPPELVTKTRMRYHRKTCNL